MSESYSPEELTDFQRRARSRAVRLWKATGVLIVVQVAIYWAVPKLIPYLTKPEVLLIAMPIVVGLALFNYLVYCFAIYICPACRAYPGADWRRILPTPAHCRKCGVPLTAAGMESAHGVRKAEPPRL